MISARCLEALGRVGVVAALLIAGSAGTVAAQTTTAGAASAPADFAKGSTIVLNAAAGDAGPAQRLIVPKDVYSTVVRRDLGDLRVFNGAGREVPYVLHRPASTGEFTEWQSLTVFPLPVVPPDASGGAKVDIELAGSGAVVAVRGAERSAAHRQTLLVDASGFKKSIAELRVRWSVPADDVIGHFRVEASNDLDKWRNVVNSSTVASLHRDGERVVVDTITLPANVSARYLKLTQLDGPQDWSLSAVSVRSRVSRLPERHWLTLPGVAVDGGVEYAVPAVIPVDRMDFSPEDGGQGESADVGTFLISVHVYAKAVKKNPWRDRGTRTTYRVEVNNTIVRSDPHAVSSNDLFWRAEILRGDQRLPQLSIGWVPHELVFLKQGPSPFTLAYGQAGVSGAQWPVTSVLGGRTSEAEVHTLPLASLSTPVPLGGPQRLDPAPEPIDWQTVLLWCVLVAGVMLVGGIAYRVVKS